VLRALLGEPRVSPDAVYGAFCGYLLIALVFAHLYCLLESAQPGSFKGSPELAGRLASAADRLFVLNYFSLVTLTTVGYGDVVPAADAARGLVCLEAMLGQFYIAGLVAELIGRKVSQAFTDRPPEAG
jgi:voltage-gated potassium channel